MSREKLVGVGLLALAFIAGVGGGYAGAASERPVVIYQTLPEGEDRGVARVWLTVDHYGPDGRLRGRLVKEGDPFTENFGKFIQLLFKKDTDAYQVVTTGGASITIRKYSYDFSDYYAVTGTSGADQVKIQIGSGTAPFSLDDYSLSSMLQEAVASVPSFAVSGNEMNITFSATFGFNANYSISETGVIVKLQDAAGANNMFYVLVLRDLISPAISVGPGDSLTITYIFQING